MIKVVKNFAELYALSNPPTSINDKDIVYVEGFWDENDGGGGFFIFDKFSTLETVYSDASAVNFKSGYDINYDGMICRAENLTDGRWIRQWDRGKLNLRWFGALPSFSSSRDASWALNAALKYAQFKAEPFLIDNPNAGQPNEPDRIPNPDRTLFNYEVYTRPSKTIYIPTGRYNFFSPISDITYGVVIEGEGNVGTSSHGTHLLILHDYIASDYSPAGYDQDVSGFFRFIANAEHNSGGGLRSIKISVDSSVTFDTNIVSLLSTIENPGADGNTYSPAVSKWLGENLVFILRGKARRAMFMKSSQLTGDLPWRIRDIMLMNCWFAGASLSGETVRAENVSELHIIGGFFSSGLGVGVDGIAPGIYLGGIHGCANTHLNGVDLTHGIIKIEKKSLFINIDCRFGKLLVNKQSGNDHEGLHVSKRHVFNRRSHASDSILLCSNDPSPTSYRCYNNSTDIEADSDWD